MSEVDGEVVPPIPRCPKCGSTNPEFCHRGGRHTHGLAFMGGIAVECCPDPFHRDADYDDEFGITVGGPNCEHPSLTGVDVWRCEGCGQLTLRDEGPGGE